MAEVYTVSFFGNKELKRYAIVRDVEALVRRLVWEKEYVEFLVGRGGQFEALVSAVIRKVKREYRDDNSRHIAILTDGMFLGEKTPAFIERFYDCAEVCEEAEKARFNKKQICSRYMVDRSDLTVFYIEKEYGDAYITRKYAIKQKKEIVEI